MPGFLASQHQELQDRFVVDLGNALHGRYRVAFQQKAENHLGLLDRQVHPVQGVIAGVGEYLAALDALISLATLALSELAAFGTAVVTGHGFLRGKPIMELRSALRLTPRADLIPAVVTS
jgi:hypothetical protein